MAKPTRWTQETIDDYVRRGIWEDITLFDLWDRNARISPEREAVVDSDNRVTWAQAKLWIDRLAIGFLELGLNRDDLIVVQLPNGVEQSLLRVACEKAGLLCLPALRNLRHFEMEYILGHSEAVGVVIPWEHRGFDFYDMILDLRPKCPKLRHIFVVGDKVPEGALSILETMNRPVEKDYSLGYLKDKGLKATEVSLIIPTTGTTGLPKFVEFISSSRIWQWKKNTSRLGLTGDDILGLITPHSGGIAMPATFGAPLVGAKLTILQSTDVEDAFRLIESERVTFACVVPTQLAMMADHPNRNRYDLSSIRLWWCTGAALPYEIAVRAEAALGGIIVTVFGASDWGCEVMNLPDAPREIRFRTVGKPIDGSTVRLVDDEGNDVPAGEVGEIWGSGPTGVSGYFKDWEATTQVWTEDGWYRTGDLGRFDKNGNLVVVGRKKDMIIRGGMNIYPIEMENLLLKHPKVRDVAIVGMPDPLMGQRACAFVVPHHGQEFAFEEMVSFLKGKKVSSFKIPERLELIKEIPSVGGEGQKTDKKRLVEMSTQMLKAEGKLAKKVLT